MLINLYINCGKIFYNSQGEKKREQGGRSGGGGADAASNVPNEIVACTNCGGDGSPCTHSATNNGCATEVISHGAVYIVRGHACGGVSLVQNVIYKQYDTECILWSELNELPLLSLLGETFKRQRERERILPCSKSFKRAMLFQAKSKKASQVMNIFLNLTGFEPIFYIIT
jgi:hypothetical protein